MLLLWRGGKDPGPHLERNMKNALTNLEATIAASNAKQNEADTLRGRAHSLDQEAFALECVNDYQTTPISKGLRSKADSLRVKAQEKANEACALVNTLLS